MKMKQLFYVSACIVLLAACKKKNDPAPEVPAGPFNITQTQITGTANGNDYMNVPVRPIIKLSFSAGADAASATANILMNESTGTAVPVSISYERNDSVVVIQPSSGLKYLTRYSIRIFPDIQSKQQKKLGNTVTINLVTTIDSSRKFPAITDDALLTLVQRQHFKYFWDFGHPTSGLARERNTSGDLVTSGGSGFGIMAIVTGIHRQFITRAEGLARIQKITTFLKTNAKRFHGAFPHWLNGVTGDVIPFSAKDDGADLVETSYLMQGLLTARQYFNGADAAETALRADINTLYNQVEWNWFRKNNENVLYWHWSPNYAWDMNHQIKGWNECLITYALAASSTTFTIPKEVYGLGWASNGGFKNGQTYYGYQLPLGPSYGGPLFFAHYSFLGINPNSLTDAYANYWDQNRNHTLINYNYCVSNVKNYFGYSDSCWGLTASDDINGYKAHEPANDNGVISPTAALSSFPYTSTESMKALKFFYYVLGDKLWKEYGFVDAFSLHHLWFADSFLAIDQGPILIMIENHRSGLLWELFMSCPEVKTGMKKLGFQSPYL
ncbi:MAG: glucoamylase family protein [Chitinophagaceae bacterium]